MSNRNSSRSYRNSGSSENGEPEFLVIGKLRRPHGVRGEIVMSVWTDFPERIEPGASAYIGEKHIPVSIRSVRWHRQDILIAFDDWEDRDQVGMFRNHLIYVRADDRPVLPEGEFYLHQIVGLRVVRDENNAFLGVIEEIIKTGANDVFLVRADDGKELLLPDIPSVVLSIDLEQREVRVHLLPGLLPSEE